MEEKGGPPLNFDILLILKVKASYPPEKDTGMSQSEITKVVDKKTCKTH